MRIMMCKSMCMAMDNMMCSRNYCEMQTMKAQSSITPYEFAI